MHEVTASIMQILSQVPAAGRAYLQQRMLHLHDVGPETTSDLLDELARSNKIRHHDKDVFSREENHSCR